MTEELHECRGASLQPPTSSLQPQQQQQQQHQHRHRCFHSDAVIKFSVFVGIFLVRILDGVPWLWGNLAVYVSSYYFANGHESSGEATSWVLGMDVIGFNIGILVGGLLTRHFGIGPVLFTGILAFNASIMLSYFSLQHSVVILCISFGFIPGLSGGIVESCQLALAVKWTRKYTGLATSSVPSSNIISAVAMNLVLTLYINPSNKQPDLARDTTRLFSQPDIIERVPYAFILFGGMSLGLALIGFLLIRETPGRTSIVIEMCHRFANLTLSGEKVHLTASNPSLPGRQPSTDPEYKDRDPLSPITMATSQDITPRQALRRREFYALCAFAIIQTYGFFIINTFYKAFGLVYIPDDHFLTIVAMVKCLCTPVCTWIAGFAVDKVGLKITIVTTAAIFCVVSSLFYLSSTNKWMYLISCVLYGCSLFSLFCLTVPSCVNIFGGSYFTTILGMVLASTYPAIVCLPRLSEWVISSFGWFPLFASVSVLAFCGVVILIWHLPENTRS